MSGNPDRLSLPPEALASNEAVTPPRMKVRFNEPFTVPPPDFSRPWLDDTEGYGTEYEYAERRPGHYPFEIEGEGIVGRIQITQKSLAFSDRHSMHTPAGPVVAQLIVDGDKSAFDMKTLPFNVEVDVEDVNVAAEPESPEKQVPQVQLRYMSKAYIGEPIVSAVYIDEDKDDVPVRHHEFWHDIGEEKEDFKPTAFPVDPSLFDDLEITLILHQPDSSNSDRSPKRESFYS